MDAQRGSPTLGSASEPTEPWGALIRPVNTDRVCRDAYLAKKVRYTVVTRGVKRPRLVLSLQVLVDRDNCEVSMLTRV